MIHVGGYQEYRGECSVPWGTQITKDFSLHSTEHPHGTHDIPHGTEYPPRYSRYPHGTHDIPHGTQDIPHGTQDISHGTEHPHGTAHTFYRVKKSSGRCISSCQQDIKLDQFSQQIPIVERLICRTACWCSYIPTCLEFQKLQFAIHHSNFFIIGL